MARHELLDEIDSPFPLGGAFGYWGYDLKNFTDASGKLAFARPPSTIWNCPITMVVSTTASWCSTIIWAKVSIVSTGLNADGSRNRKSRAE